VLDGYPGDARPAVLEFLRSLNLAGQRSFGAVRNESQVEPVLSPREHDILRLVANGLTNRDMAAELVISVRTVARHITNIYAKIGVRSKAEATAYALRHGLD
jgi:DNA-binding NarL/FixJ family response regulator